MRPINLLPPESRRKAAAKRKQAAWILLAVVYLAVLGLIFFWERGKVDEAEQERDEQQLVVDDLRREIGQLEDLRSLKEGLDGRVAVVSGILATDISWGRVLNDFGRLIPPRVWLESFTGSVTPLEEAATGEGIGRIQVAGTAFDFPDVASWLRSLDSANFPAVDQTWVNTVSANIIGQAEVVTFSSATFLTDAALSQRFAERIPEIP